MSPFDHLGLFRTQQHSGPVELNRRMRGAAPYIERTMGDVISQGRQFL